MQPVLAKVQHTQLALSQERAEGARQTRASARTERLARIEEAREAKEKAVEAEAASQKKIDNGHKIGALLGGVVGAVVGFIAGGPVGAVAGAALGSAAGSAIGGGVGQATTKSNQLEKGECEKTAGLAAAEATKDAKESQKAAERMRDALSQEENVHQFAQQTRQAALEASVQG